MFYLLGVIHGLGFADQVDLDLAGVFELCLDLLGDVVGHEDHVVLGHVLGLDHDADLAAGLDGVGLLHAGEGAGELLELLQAADVVRTYLTRGRPRWALPARQRRKR